MPCPCRAHSVPMPCSWRAMPCLWRAHAVPIPCPFRVHAVLMTCPCHVHDVPIPCPCRAHAVPMPCSCRAHAVPMPCRTAKGLECFFPICFTQCSRVCFTLAMPCPCHAQTMPFFSRPRHSTSVERRPVGYLLAFGFFRLPRGVPRMLLSEACQSQM